MNKNKHEYPYKIIALIADGQEVYVGKTTNRDLSAVRRNHTQGRCTATKDSRIAREGSNVKMYILETLTSCHSLAYRHVVAWCRIFEDAGYPVVNHPGTLDDAADLHPETQLLVDLIRRKPLEDILARAEASLPKLPDATEPDDLADPPEKSDDAPTKLTVRLTCTEKELFGDLAMTLDMTQRELLLYLMDYHEDHNAAGGGDQSLSRLKKQLERSCAALKTENAKLLRQLEQLKASPEQRAPAMTKLFRAANDGVRAYFQLLPAPVAPPLPKINYKAYRNAHPELRTYRYKQVSGVYIFHPSVILYGSANPPVRFWVGMDDGQQPIKIRIYDKPDSFGISPMHQYYCRQGISWLVSTRTAADGAEDLVFALPLPFPPKSQPAPLEKLSLDEQIARARRL